MSHTLQRPQRRREVERVCLLSDNELREINASTLIKRHLNCAADIRQLAR